MQKSEVTSAYVAVGSNIDPLTHIEAGLRALAEYVRVVDISTVYASRPSERPEQPDFVNGVLLVETERDPWSLKFDVLREVESRQGRRRERDKHAARTLDLDLILFGDKVIRSDDLVLPDPDIYKAPYVYFPLAELAPDLILPDTGVRAGDLGAKGGAGLTPMPTLTASLKGWLAK